LRDKYLFYGAISIISIYLFPLFLFGEDSLIEIHDTLDYIHVIHKVLAESGLIFSPTSATIPNFLNGVPRSTFGSEFNIVLWFYYFFGPFYAEVLQLVCKRFIAFWGMYRLLNNHVISSDQKLISVGVALTFALLPWNAMQGVTVVGQALALDIFLTIRKGKSHWCDWLIIALLPLASGFVFSFIFFLFFMTIIWLYDILIKKDPQVKFILAIFFMTTLFLGVEYRVLYAMFFDPTFVSVRTEFFSFKIISSLGHAIFKYMQLGFTRFIGGHTLSFHYATALQTLFIIPVAIVGIFIAYDRRLNSKPLILLVLFSLFLHLSYGIIQIPFHWEGTQWLIKEFEIFRTFRFYRFYFFTPILWYLIFAFSLKYILNYSRKGLQVVCIILALQTGYAFFYHDEIQQRNNKPTYQAFFAKNQFSAIEQFIGKDKSTYKVVSVGIHPSIALYNGFYTLDAYHANYPVEHKHAFRKIIEKELDKNPKNKAYFDDFAGRCYVFAAELAHGDWIYTKERNKKIQNLELNIEEFKKMGGEYVFSSVKIINYRKNQLELIKIFEDEVSAWKIFLYRPIGLEKKI